MKSQSCSKFFSGYVILLFVVLFAGFPLAGFGGSALVSELESVRQEVLRLEAKHHLNINYSGFQTE